MKTNPRFFTGRFFVTLLSVIAIGGGIFAAGCSSSDSKGSSVYLASPSNLSLSAKSLELTIQFGRVAAIGTEGSQDYPSYNVSIARADNPYGIVFLGNFPSNDSLLVRFVIKPEKDGTETFPVFKYPIEDGVEYIIYVSSVFSGWGESAPASIAATPIPMPQAVQNAKVAAGDKRLLITWTARPYENYSVQVDDCPKKPGQLSKWSPTKTITGNNYVFSLDNNTDTHSVCMVAFNENGNGEWFIFGKVGTDSITYDEYKGQDATQKPDVPNIKSAEGATKRVTVTFDVAASGAKSVSKYEIAYRKSGENTWSALTEVPVTSLIGSATVSGLENLVQYEFLLRASNFAGYTDAVITGTPVQTVKDFNNPDEFLGTAAASYIYAEDVPHSDFWRISQNFNAGGRPNSDRLTRGKETALGNLFADGLKWYVDEKYANARVDFAILIGDMINTGIQANTSITPRFLMGIMKDAYLDDNVVIAQVSGSYLIKELDYNINLRDYPALDGNSGYGETIFGQAASVYRNGHYGGSGGTTYNGVYWAMPSKEARYTIEYLPYDLSAFQSNFNTKCSAVNKTTGIDSTTNQLYDSEKDGNGCYLMSYNDAWPASGNPSENSVIGYKRGRIKSGSLTIGGKAIDPSRTYIIATTKTIADSMYVGFLNASEVLDTGVTLVRALSEYIADKGTISPYLDGRVKLEGGVPGNTDNDYH